MKKFYKWYWKKLNTGEGTNEIWVLVWVPTVLFLVIARFG
jgi:hypothetical protein